MIYQLEQLPKTAEPIVGGKARVLAQLIQQGYPVPAAFVISPDSFENGELGAKDWREALQAADSLSGANGRFSKLAVRSSAVSEDSAAASFAGEFESILNVQGEMELRTAVQRVYDSQFSERVAAYSEAQGLGRDHQMAVIVQEMVSADLAGVLFTADPVTSSHHVMSGNFVRGLGERLVSGEADGETFSLERPSGGYSGPAVLKPFAKRLFRLGERLVDLFGGPQDIEWAIAGNKLFILQSRPITTMQSYNPATGETNDSLRGDYLWSSTNFGEAIPGGITP
jgi:pyruvate,water dikinase